LELKKCLQKSKLESYSPYLEKNDPKAYELLCEINNKIEEANNIKTKLNKYKEDAGTEIQKAKPLLQDVNSSLTDMIKIKEHLITAEKYYPNHPEIDSLNLRLVNNKDRLLDKIFDKDVNTIESEIKNLDSMKYDEGSKISLYKEKIIQELRDKLRTKKGESDKLLNEIKNDIDNKKELLDIVITLQKLDSLNSMDPTINLLDNLKEKAGKKFLKKINEILEKKDVTEINSAIVLLSKKHFPDNEFCRDFEQKVNNAKERLQKEVDLKEKEKAK
jgi:hypothetical protein